VVNAQVGPGGCASGMAQTATMRRQSGGSKHETVAISWLTSNAQIPPHPRIISYPAALISASHTTMHI
jgi:hypothetical protein